MNSYLTDVRQWLEQLNRLENQMPNGPKSRASHKALIETLRANLPPGVLMRHDHLRARGRQSIAEVRQGVCSGCHLGLPIGVAAAMQRRTELLLCTNCGRYIFLANDELARIASLKLLAQAPKPARKRSH